MKSILLKENSQMDSSSYYGLVVNVELIHAFFNPIKTREQNIPPASYLLTILNGL